MTYNFGDNGKVDRSEGTLVNNTWTWMTEYNVGGKIIKTREITMPTSATSYDFKWEVAANGNDWKTVQEGKATKVK